MDYAINSKEKVHALGTFPVSTSKAALICKMINRKKFADAKKILEKLASKEDSIDGKYYTKTIMEIKKFLKQLEDNAKMQNIDADTLNLFISSHRGPTMYRGKRDRRHGVKMKSTHVQAVLSDKDGFGKKVR